MYKKMVKSDLQIAELCKMRQLFLLQGNSDHLGQTAHELFMGKGYKIIISLFVLAFANSYLNISLEGYQAVK
jgi:hypothetical protein